MASPTGTCAHPAPAPPRPAEDYRLLDDDRPGSEQLPRHFVASFEECTDRRGRPAVAVSIDGHRAPDTLRDKSYVPDGYRFHDVFHLAHAAYLGWSPVLRTKLLTPPRRRVSAPVIAEVEDGGRAIGLEEAVVAITWDYARHHGHLADADRVAYATLKTIASLTGMLEVHVRTLDQVEEAILAGYAVWRTLYARGGGLVEVDLRERRLEVIG